MTRQKPLEIMWRGSTTFFNSSLFFPRDVRADVVTLYAFVRTADDFVDSVPQDPEGFFAFKDEYRRSVGGGESGDPVVAAFVDLSCRRAFEAKWAESFLKAMEQDLTKTSYLTMSETEEYMEGSAEAVGMMMARIMSLPDESVPCARLLGKAFQYLNFVRDIKEDLEMGRVYIAQEEIARAGLPELSLDHAYENPENFKNLIRAQIRYYRMWRAAAAEGYRFIPRRYLTPIRTAADVFEHTACTIDSDPFIVWRRKVKPNRMRVLINGVRNLLAVNMPRRRAAGTA